MPNVKSFTPINVLDHLSGICESRFIAISQYPHAWGAKERFASIELIRFEIKQARSISNDQQIIKACLKIEDHLRFVGPTRTLKLWKTYQDKVSSVMNACRVFLAERRIAA